jgi:DNA-binding transcriptional MerR regulator
MTNDMPRPQRLVSSGRAAEAVNVAPQTLRLWVADGDVVPTDRTGGGHARWDLDDLRRQIAAMRERRTSKGRPPASQPVIDTPDSDSPRVTEPPEPAAQSVTELVGSGAAAEAVGVTKSGLTKWMREGLITPAKRVGRRGDARWDLDELRRQMAARGLQGRTPPAGGSASDRHPPHLPS